MVLINKTTYMISGNFAFHGGPKYTPIELDREFDEGFAICRGYNIIDILSKGKGLEILLALDKTVREATDHQPDIMVYAAQLICILDMDISKGRLNRLRTFREKYERMKNDLGGENALFHLTNGLIKLLDNAGEIRPKKETRIRV